MPTYTQQEPKSGGALHVPPGTYDIEVVSATERINDKRQTQFVLSCQVLMPNGDTGPVIKELLTFSDKAGWKIDQVRAACGMAVVAGEEIDVQTEHFVDAKAVVEIIDKPGDNPGVVFNSIKRWLLPDEAGKAAKVKAPAVKEDDGDDIPF